MQGAGSAVERRVPVLPAQRWHGCAGREAGSSSHRKRALAAHANGGLPRHQLMPLCFLDCSTLAQGYALMCVSLPLTDCVLETVPEDDAYMLQVGAQHREGCLLQCCLHSARPARIAGAALVTLLQIWTAFSFHRAMPCRSTLTLPCRIDTQAALAPPPAPDLGTLIFLRPALPSAPQFGRQFDELATDPNAPSVERDDFAIELAMLDE